MGPALNVMMRSSTGLRSMVSLQLLLASLLVMMEHSKCAGGVWLGKLHGHAHNLQNDRLLASLQWHQTQSRSSQILVKSPRIFFATDYGADPTGGSDSTIALQQTMNDAFDVASTHVLMPGIVDLGGVEIHLGGGQYVISKPLTFPDSGGGNVLVHGGTIRASATFPTDGYLIEAATTELRDEWDERKKEDKRGGGVEAWRTDAAFENIRFRDLLLDGNFTAGGILLLNALRTTISNCYVMHFGKSSVGINVQGGHETLIHHSFLGQHVTSGADPSESTFSGTAIILAGNDNAVTDVIVFSAAVGVEITGQANIVTGVHFYNKATHLGGVGIIVRQGADQTRMLGCYMDYTGITLEESKQISITDSFFLGDAYILLKAPPSSTPPPVVFGILIAHNMFSGSGHDVPIVQVMGNFSQIKQTSITDNSVSGMALRSTRARASTAGFGTNWTFDLSQTLLFPNAFAHVHYSFFASPNATNHSDNTPFGIKSYPRHALDLVTRNSIMVSCDTPVQATVSIDVDQSSYDDNESIPNLYT